MTGRERLECAEMKLRKKEEQGGTCPRCGRRLPVNAQLAHKINQGPNNIRNLERVYSSDYGRGIGKKIIHHRFNMDLTCPGPCNSKNLVDNKPIERQELIDRILTDLAGEDATT